MNMGTEEKSGSFFDLIRQKVHPQKQEEETAVSCEETRKLQQMQEDVVWLKRLLAHNFRMPMAVIDGYAKQLMEGDFEDREECRMVIGKICKNIDYMNTMLKVVLDDGNDGMLDAKEVFDLLGCIREGIEYVKAIARRQGVRITMNSTKNVVFIYGNRIKLMRAFFNLIENSLKYMKREGSIFLTVDQTDDAVYVIYKDNGIGMNTEEATHISEWNYQGTNQANGYGIGMYLVKETVHDFGGTMEISSSEGKGMGVYMTFPVPTGVPE